MESIGEFEEINFDFDFGNKNGKEQKTSDRYKKQAKQFLEKIDVRIEKVKKNTYQIINNVINDLKLPQKGEQIRIRMQQQISLISMVMKIVEQNKKIDELIVVTYTLNREALQIFIDLFKNGKIKKMRFLIASSYSFRDPKYYEEIKETFKGLKNKNANLAFAWTHLKITLARCENDYYQIEGSMNYSANNMAEQILFENNKKTFEYDKKFINEVITQRKNKAVEFIC